MEASVRELAPGPAGAVVDVEAGTEVLGAGVVAVVATCRLLGLWLTTPAIPVPITASDRPSRPISKRFTGGQTSGGPGPACVITSTTCLWSRAGTAVVTTEKMWVLSVREYVAAPYGGYSGGRTPRDEVN